MNADGGDSSGKAMIDEIVVTSLAPSCSGLNRLKNKPSNKDLKEMNALPDENKPGPKAAQVSQSKGPLIYVGRHGCIIGEYYLPSIQKGIACGYFVPKDRGWYEGLPEWLRIGEVVKLLTTPATQRDSLIPVPNLDKAQVRATKVLTARLTQKLRLELDSAVAR